MPVRRKHEAITRTTHLTHAYSLPLLPLPSPVSTSAFLKVLERFKRDYIPHILGFKFRQYTTWGDQAGEKEEKRPTPPSLYMLAALLLSSGLMDFSLFVNHLKPDLKVLLERQVRFLEA